MDAIAGTVERGREMKDLIYRQDAIDALFSEGRNVDSRYFLTERIIHESDAIEAISMLPSAQQWTPVTEGLPKITEHHVSEVVICYLSNGAYCFGSLEENPFGQTRWSCERDDEYYQPVGKVLAWMPLPEPFKGGDAE